MKRYKATLFKTACNGQDQRPIDSILLEKKCHTTAENFFFNKRGWKKAEHYHIEIDDLPRFLA